MLNSILILCGLYLSILLISPTWLSSHPSPTRTAVYACFKVRLIGTNRNLELPNKPQVQAALIGLRQEYISVG